MDAVNPPQAVSAENEREKRSFWEQWIKGAKKGADQHWKDAKAAWEEYENPSLGNRGGATSKDVALRCHPVYWSTCKTIESAYYSPQGNTDFQITRRFGITDDVALTASVIKERFATYLCDQSDIDDVMIKAVLDLIHADKTTTQVLCDVDKEEQQALEDGSQPDPIVTKVKIYPGAILYDEILHTPDANCESQITDKAYHFSLSKEEATARFSPEVLANIQWKTSRSLSAGDDKPEDKKDREIPGKFVEGWECWSKVTKRVYWVSPQYPDDFLDVKDDPYKLRDFFPSPPFIFGSRPAKHLYPTPWYHQLKPMADQLHEITRKCYGLIKAIERKALVDDPEGTITLALNTLGSNQYLAVKGMRALLEKGGLENCIYWIPVQELVQSLSELDSIEEKFSNKFYQWSGVPDILQGNSDPQEPLGSQKIKQTHAYGRFEVQVGQIARLKRDTVSMMVDLGLGVMPDEMIMRCVGFNYMEPQHQQRFTQALALLRDDEEETIRLEISSDSISFLKKQLKQQQKNALAQTVNQGLAAIAQAARDNPAIASVMLNMLLVTLEQMEGGKDIMEGVKATVSQLISNLSQPQEPGPDYKQMELDLRNKAIDITGMKAEMENFAKSREVERLDYETQMKDRNMQVSEQVEMVKSQLAQVESQMAARIQSFTEYVGQAQLELERYKTTLDEREKFIEEQRLSMEAQAENARIQTTPPESQLPPEPQPPTIIQVPMPVMPTMNITVGKGTTRIIRDPITGEVLGSTDEEPTPSPILPILPVGGTGLMP